MVLSIISCFGGFGGFPFHNNFSNKISIFTNRCYFGLGRDSRICINFEIKRLLIIFIFPINVEFLVCQILIYFSISKSLVAMFKSVMVSRIETS